MSQEEAGALVGHSRYWVMRYEAGTMPREYVQALVDAAPVVSAQNMAEMVAMLDEVEKVLMDTVQRSAAPPGSLASESSHGLIHE